MDSNSSSPEKSPSLGPRRSEEDLRPPIADLSPPEMLPNLGEGGTDPWPPIANHSTPGMSPDLGVGGTLEDPWAHSPPGYLPNFGGGGTWSPISNRSPPGILPDMGNGGWPPITNHPPGGMSPSLGAGATREDSWPPIANPPPPGIPPNLGTGATREDSWPPIANQPPPGMSPNLGTGATGEDSWPPIANHSAPGMFRNPDAGKIPEDLRPPIGIRPLPEWIPDVHKRAIWEEAWKHILQGMDSNLEVHKQRARDDISPPIRQPSDGLPLYFRGRGIPSMACRSSLPDMLPNIGTRRTVEPPLSPTRNQNDLRAHSLLAMAPKYEAQPTHEHSLPPAMRAKSKFANAAEQWVSDCVAEMDTTPQTSMPEATPTLNPCQSHDVGRDVRKRLEELGLGSYASTSPSSGPETGRSPSPVMGTFSFQHYPGKSYNFYDCMNAPSIPIIHQSDPPGSGAAPVASTSTNIPNQNYRSDLDSRLPTHFGSASESRPTPSTKVRLNVYPEKRVNFTRCQIRFNVQAINVPSGATLGSCRIEGLVMTPNGRTIPCLITEAFKTDPYQTDFFTGTFSSLEEVGLHLLHVRLILPLEHRMLRADIDSMVITEEAQIIVSKNYFRDSQKSTAESFQLDFTPWQFPSGDAGADNARRRDRPYFLSKAWGISCDTLTNRLYCTDRNGHSLTCLDQEGQPIFKLPQPEVGSHKFNRPTGICCDELNRRVLIADKDNHRISFFSMDGLYISSFGGVGHANGCFSFPWDVAASPRGNRIAVTDSRNKRVQLFDREGNFLNKFSIYETSPFEYKNNFDYPRGITFNNEGTSIFVTDFKSNNIVEIPVDDMSTLRKVLPQRKLYRPQGIVVDSMHNLLVCDSKNQCVRHLSPQDGQSLCQVHSVAKERFNFPVNLTLMKDGRLAVLDSQGRIRIF